MQTNGVSLGITIQEPIISTDQQNILVLLEMEELLKVWMMDK